MNYPDFFDSAPIIQLHDGLAELLGAATDGIMTYRYVDAVRLAGHSCPTVAAAFLTCRAALAALYPGALPERGHIKASMPAPETEGTIGVTAQVITLITGAAGRGGFKGLGEQFGRNELLEYARAANGHGDSIQFERIDTGAAVAVSCDVGTVPADPALPALIHAVIADRASAAERAEFASAWQDRVRRILLEHADDPEVVRVNPIATNAIA